MKFPRFALTPLLLLGCLALSSAACAFEEREISLEQAALSLEQAVNLAKKNNRQIQESVHNFNIAQKKISETRAQFNPGLKLDGNWQRVHDPSSFTIAAYSPRAFMFSTDTTVLDLSSTPPAASVVTAGTAITYAEPTAPISAPLSAKNSRTLDLTFSVPLLTFGAKGKSLKAQRLGRNSAELDVERLSLEVTLNTKESFFNYVLALAGLEVMKRNLALAEEHLAGSNARYEQGTIPYFDVIRAEVAVAEAREQLTKAQAGADLARMALNNVLGVPVERGTRVRYEPGSVSIPALAPVDKYVDYALANRVELVQLQNAIHQARLGAQLSKNRPMVAFAYLRNLLSSGSSFSSENSWRYVVSYSMQMYDSGVARAREHQGAETAQRLELQAVDAREGIILQTRQAYLNLDEAIKRLETSRAIMRQAQRAREMADVGYGQGVVSELDWKDALFGEMQAGLNLNKAEFDLQMAKARLARALGLENLEDF